MTLSKLLVANRGEIAVRILRAAAALGLPTVAVHSRDDARSLHVRMADEAVALAADGPAAYLDIGALVAAARLAGCDAVHPGYGFLSESAAFARAVREAGMVFVGPQPSLLDLFGDKARARELAAECGVPLMPGTHGATGVDEARAFLAAQGAGAAMMIKAIAGGGGRGMRLVHEPEEVEPAWLRCRSEAAAAFGNPDVYVERYLAGARHIEIQVLGDGHEVIHLGERECSIQRRNQKVVEIAPSPTLNAVLRERLCEAALRIARRVGYQGLGTFEFLVADGVTVPGGFVFIEVNPRLQVEHTVTEQVLGIDLVQAQLRVAAGATLADLGLAGYVPSPVGYAIQLRINMETLEADGSTRPSGGTLEAFDVPGGPGIRVDTFGYTGYASNPRYDSLLAKLIVHSPSPDYAQAVQRAQRALAEFRIEGLATNIGLLRRLLQHPDFIANRVHTRFIEEHLASLLSSPQQAGPEHFFRAAAQGVSAQKIRSASAGDVLAVFESQDSGAAQGASVHRATAAAFDDGPPGTLALIAPLQGTVVSIEVAPGDAVRRGQQVLVLEAMKMEHLVSAQVAGTVVRIDVAVGDAVYEKTPLVRIDPSHAEGDHAADEAAVDPDLIRPDLADVLTRQAALLDAQRPDAVARRRRTGQRTVRENIADLCDADSFVEYGGLAVATQRQRRSLDELRAMSPADGMIAGLGTVNAPAFGEEAARCAVLAYDYTVFAGTQGVMNHRKKDRMLSLCERWEVPLVVLAEGGGGRPGDEWPTPAGLETSTFWRLGALSGLVPTVGVVSGRCFAGNAAMLGACDVVIAAENSNIGMGGPAMIEGGGLGIFKPEDVGPMSVQVPNGVVDVAVRDEAQGIAMAKKYLSYFQGRVSEWTCADQRLLRHAVPENRMRSYDVRAVIDTLADTDTVLELRPSYGEGMITAFIRLEGRPMGVIANNSRHLGGAIDAAGGDKAARFMRLCDAFDLPIISLCDTPGMMVGPEVEKTAQVRRVSRMFVAAANVTVPIFTVVLRKGYGLGALAMCGGSSLATFMVLSWPTGEFGPMGLEGGVKLGYRKELLAIEDPAQRKAWFDMMVAKAYEENKALSSATFMEVDDVIDPVDTRRRILRGLNSIRPRERGLGKKVSSLDVW